MIKFSSSQLSTHIATAHRLLPRGRKPGDLSARNPAARPDYAGIFAFLSNFNDTFMADMTEYLEDEHINSAVPPGSNALHLQRLLCLLRMELANNLIGDQDGPLVSISDHEGDTSAAGGEADHLNCTAHSEDDDEEMEVLDRFG